MREVRAGFMLIPEYGASRLTSVAIMAPTHRPVKRRQAQVVGEAQD